MSEERCKDIKEKCISLVETKLNGDLSKVCASELGEVSDIAKDMAEIKKFCAEAKYYEKITEAMEKSSKEEREYYMGMFSPETQVARYYTNPLTSWKKEPMWDEMPAWRGDNPKMTQKRYYKYPADYYDEYWWMYGGDEMDRKNERENGRMYYTDPMSGRNTESTRMPQQMQNSRDSREGKSGMTRKMYVEMIDSNADKDKRMEEIKQYSADLTEDVMAMIQKASPEEKALLKQRFTVLANKIV